jgi:RNA polymerase sigma-70 factor, ECF subfamily
MLIFGFYIFFRQLLVSLLVLYVNQAFCQFSIILEEIVEISEHRLVMEMVSGSNPAFVNLYNKYKQPIYVFCLKMVCDRAIAMDIVQGVFIKVLERRRQISQPALFKSWLYTIARNDCISFFRINDRFDHLDEARLSDPDEAQPSPLHHVEVDEQIQYINRAIEKLKPLYREVILLREYQNLSYSEIAGIIDIEESLVKSRLFTARRQLYEMLKEYFPERNRTCNVKKEHRP